jgi:hypothetical protein
MDSLVKALEETRPVAVLEGSGPTRYRSEFPKMGQQRPARKRFADGILCEFIPAWTKHSSSLVEATLGQKDIRRDHNIICCDMLNNPVIDSIVLPFDNHKFVPLPMGNANPRIGDDSNMETVSLRHAVHLLLYRAAIGINEYLKHIVGVFGFWRYPGVSPRPEAF